jgi:hypothetical membrane protein
MCRTAREALRWTAGIVAAVVPVLFIALTVVLGALWPGYDPVRDTMSELGAVDAPHRLVMNVAGFMGLGVSILAFGVVYALTFRAGWPAGAAVAFLVVAGLGMVIVGFHPCDAGCVDVTATGRLHSVFSAPGAIGLPTAAMLSSWVFDRDGRLGRVWQLTSIALGALTLASGPVVAAGLLVGVDGLAQRAGMWPALLWMTTVAVRTSRLPATSRSRLLVTAGSHSWPV